MRTSQYYTAAKKKRWVILHHTAGHDSPINTIEGWNNDSRGRIGTQYVIGGQSSVTGRARWDGHIYEAFPDGCFAWHTGTGSSALHQESIGIELCNIGYVINNQSYVGTKVIASQQVQLPNIFRGHWNWHRYSDSQLDSLKKLLLHLGTKHNIDLHKGLYDWVKKYGAAGFDFCDLTYANTNPGLYTHANLVRSKSDVFPQPELIDLIRSL